MTVMCVLAVKLENQYLKHNSYFKKLTLITQIQSKIIERYDNSQNTRTQTVLVFADVLRAPGTINLVHEAIGCT